MCEYCQNDKPLFEKKIGELLDIGWDGDSEYYEDTHYLKIEKRGNGDFLRLADENEHCLDAYDSYIRIKYCPICGLKLRRDSNE